MDWRDGMKISGNRAVVVGLYAALALLAAPVLAQYGHLGVNSDPIPLVQTKRQRQPALKSSPRPEPVVATNRPPAPALPRGTVNPVPLPASKTSLPTFDDHLARAEKVAVAGQA